MRAATLAKTGTGVLFTAVMGGLASRPARSAWYANLRKPSFQPPRQAFPIVWPLLYADIAAISATTLDDLEHRARGDERRTYARLLALNLVLNAGWSWLFFDRRRLGASAVTAAALTASSADLARRSLAVRGGSAAPLAVYPLWCAFATVLSSRIWWLNR